jgi:hypothetical protein
MYNKNMKTLFTVIFFACLVGCSTTNQRILTPHEVSIIPNDCLNRKEILSFLENQVRVANERKITEGLGVVKYKLWEVRTVCSGV